MTFRHDTAAPDLGVFEDKFELRSLQHQHDVPCAETIHMSRSGPNILRYIENETDYVVKPTHLSESEYVFVVRESQVINNVTMNGTTVAIPFQGVELRNFIQSRIEDAWTHHAYDFECAALRAARPGVLIERPVFNASDAVFEIQCIVVWGRCSKFLFLHGNSWSTFKPLDNGR